MQELPDNLKTIAIVQLVSGLLNIFVMAALGSFLLGTAAGTVSMICTFGFCPFGGLLGFLSCLLVPVGIVEVVVGAMGLSEPNNVVKFAKPVAVLELFSLLLGGLPSGIAGGIVFYMLRDPQVVAYIEATR